MSHVAPFTVGRTEVRVVCEGYAPLPLHDELPGTAVDWEAERAEHPWAFLDARSWPWHVHAFWLETLSGAVVVDTGLGHFPPYAPWAEPAPGAWDGLDLGAVRHVILSHLHADHAGGSVWEGEPRFPNARYHLHPADLAHFAGADDEEAYVAGAAMRRVDELGMLATDPADAEIVAGIRVLHTPGHTPGHRSVVIADAEAGATLVITGDALHQPAQVRFRDRPSSHDEDPDTGASTRQALLDRAEAHGWSVGVQHFAEPFGSVAHGRWFSR